MYEEALVLHYEKFKHDPAKIGRWNRAMTKLGNLVGWDVRNEPELTKIQKIVQEVIKRLNHKFSWLTKDLVGIQPRVEELEKFMKLSSENDDIRLLGIWGMGRIGKTTYAPVLYDRISYRFDACCFIENVSKNYKDGGAIAIQKQILRQALDEKNLDIYSSCELFGIVSHRLCNIKVLLVLDNVDQLEQHEELAINPNLLLAGSRMIITPRDKHILENYGVHIVYEVPLLNDNDAHELFYKKAFRSAGQSSSCVELILEVLKYAQRLPLAIKVVGSFLHTRDATQWRDALARLRNNPDNKIMDVLQISVDGLQHEEKEIFLHIACFFKGEKEDYVKRILDACKLYPNIGIQVMVEKSLITIGNQEIHMHDMLQELGKKIVRQQFPGEPGSRSRLWLYKDFYQVLLAETGNENIKAIVLDQKEDISRCRAEGLSTMINLRLLILHQKFFFGSLDFLSDKLQYLSWHGYPFASLPFTFRAHDLVELNMPDSKIKRLWEGDKNLFSLKRIDLSNSKYLEETPNFFGLPKLERLDLTGCTSLLRVHPSIGILENLAFLSLRNCSNLVSISFGRVSSLCSLAVLHLSGCTKLRSTPDFFTGASNLEYLDMDGCTRLSLVHESIGALTKLRFLSMRDCTNLVTIPTNINTMTSLITLDLYGCSKLRNLLPLDSAVSSSNMESLTLTSIDGVLGRAFNSPNLKSLISMDLSFCDLHEVPHAIGELSCLERLDLQGNNFASLPFTITNLSHLAYLNVSHCHWLRSLPSNIPRESASSVGRYFNTTSGSRDHRSGLYVLHCPNVIDIHHGIRGWSALLNESLELQWLKRLVKEPRHFRCGFDIVVPSQGSGFIPSYLSHKFKGNPVIRIGHSNMDDNGVGFAFCVVFEVNNNLSSKRKKEVNNNLHAISTSPHHSSSLQLPHPFYLSFESENTEERFDMPLNLKLDRINGSKQHLWIIFISKQHCHFVKTGAHITFKACPGLMVKEWGLSMVKKEGEDVEFLSSDHLVIDNVEKGSSSSELKIQLPYNWLVSEEEEVENFEAKAKENRLSNLGLYIDQPQSQWLDTDELSHTDQLLHTDIEKLLGTEELLDTDENLGLHTGQPQSQLSEEEVKTF